MPHPYVVLRDFVRYTGDGGANEPVGHPLPVGDPSSGVHNPTKKQMRDMLAELVALPSVPVQEQTGAVSARSYGADNTGATNVASTLQAAIDALAAMGGGTLLVPAGTYLISTQVNLRTKVRVQGVGYPTLRMGAGVRIFLGDGIADASVEGFAVDGNAQTGGGFVRLINTTGCRVSDNRLSGVPSTDNGSIVIFGTASERNEVSGNIINNSVGNAIGVIGSGCRRNLVDNNRINACGGFGVFVAGRSQRNTITRNRTTANGIELIGLAVGSDHNIISGNHAEGCGDNGISITGNYNVVEGNHCYSNDLSGIHLYGSLNTCTGNVCLRNGRAAAGRAGIYVQPVFGGTGQHNSITGNVCDDDQATATQTNGIRIVAASYTAWASGRAIAVGDYRLNGVRIYKAATAGTTGTTAPTHTSGTESDGGVSWESVNAFRVNAATEGNRALGNVLGRHASGGAPFLDQQNDSPSALEMRAQLNAGLAGNRREATGNMTVAVTDYIIGCRTTAPMTIGLPPASVLQVGKMFVIADEYGAAGTNNITITGNGSTINGSSTLVINTNYGTRRLYWTGTAWSASA